jgi:phospholipid-binding lipoprotein MlaA
MKKEFYFFAVFLVICLMHINVDAQNYQGTMDNKQTRPILSKESISDLSISATTGQNKNSVLYAKTNEHLSNTVKSDNNYDEELGEELDDEFDELSDEDFDEDFFDIKKTKPVVDPIYYFNYAMYSFNDFLYFAALKPLATGYKTITPVAVRKGAKNFFHNILFPVRFANNLLQGKIQEAGREIEIFLINSTLGVAGLGQFAQNELNLYTSNEDLGQTLGSYSIGDGFYLVLPILGPSSLRDTIGLAGDYFLTPVNYVEPWELSLGIKTFDSINSVSFRLGDYEILKKAAFDPYTALKNAYFQSRQEKIKN